MFCIKNANTPRLSLQSGFFFMGLDTTHNAWHGAYSAFNTWRKKIAEVAGLPPLELMEGFYDPLPPSSNHLATLYPGIVMGNEYSFSLKELDKRLPIKWNCLKPSPLFELLYHSDCDGYINWASCGKIADALEKLIPLLPDEDALGHIGNWRDKTQQFIDGCRLAHKKKEKLQFH